MARFDSKFSGPQHPIAKEKNGLRVEGGRWGGGRSMICTRSAPVGRVAEYSGARIRVCTKICSKKVKVGGYPHKVKVRGHP